MAKYVNINGRILEASKCALSVENRAFRYGDGVFETLRLINGKPVFLADHFARLIHGLTNLEMSIDSSFSLGNIEAQIVELAAKNGVEQGGRCRITCFRNPGGYYAPENLHFSYIIELTTLDKNAYEMNAEGLTIGVYDDIAITVNKLSADKTLARQVQVLAGIYAQKNQYDDCLLLNTKGLIAEAISSNVFLLIDGVLYTPDITSGCVNGVMRKQIIALAKKINVGVVETSITPESLDKCSELFLTNVVTGISWVGAFDKNRYYHTFSEKLVEALNNL